MELAARPTLPQQQNQSILWVVVISILAHVILVFAINVNFTAPNRSSAPKPINKTISAKIVWVTPEQAPPVKIEHPPKTLEPAPVSESVKQEKAPPIKPKQQEKVQREEKTDNQSEQSTLLDQPASHNAVDKHQTLNRSTAPGINTKPRMTAREMLNRYAGQINAEKQQQISQQASKEYSALKNSPKIEANPYINKYETEDEKFRKKIVKKVDCNSTSGSVLTSVSFLLGGTIECQKNPDFQKFIDKRLNKDNIK